MGGRWERREGEVYEGWRGGKRSGARAKELSITCMDTRHSCWAQIHADTDTHTRAHTLTHTHTYTRIHTSTQRQLWVAGKESLLRRLLSLSFSLFLFYSNLSDPTASMFASHAFNGFSSHMQCGGRKGRERGSCDRAIGAEAVARESELTEAD